MGDDVVNKSVKRCLSTGVDPCDIRRVATENAQCLFGIAVAYGTGKCGNARVGGEAVLGGEHLCARGEQRVRCAGTDGNVGQHGAGLDTGELIGIAHEQDFGV